MLPSTPVQVPPPEVASIAVYRDGRLLWLRRRDNGKWTLPGGHLNPGEEPMDAACRELQEETGFDPNGGHIEFVGDDATSTGLRVWSFVIEQEKGAPHPYCDPDGEAAEFKWFAPEEIPTDDQLHTPRHENITLRLLGLNDADMIKGGEFIGPEWRTPDGLRIPHHSSTARPEWDLQHKRRVTNIFAAGNPAKIEEAKVPTTLAADWKEDKNGRDRRRLYGRMVAAGDRLPPIVIDHKGNVLDGKSRLWVARHNGHNSIDAFVVHP